MMTVRPMPAPSVECSTGIRVCMCGVGSDWRDNAAASMGSRDWASVQRAISAAVSGASVLPGDSRSVPWKATIKSDSTGDGSRVTWRLAVAYYGPAFSGFAWQRSSTKPTVEETLQRAIAPLCDGATELRLSCAGRTDAGVSATGQLVSFHSWPRVLERDLSRAIDRAAPAPGALRLVRATRMERNYHAVGCYAPNTGGQLSLCSLLPSNRSAHSLREHAHLARARTACAT